MIKVLITGSIGAGKSTACKMFEKLGIPVFYSDDAAKEIMNNSKYVIDKIKKEFGDIYVNGALDRKALAEIVFNDKSKLDKLNSIIHPEVAYAFESWYGIHYVFPESEYVIEEAAIGIETGIYKQFDFVVLVTADEDVRISRVMARDNCSEAKVKERIGNQMSDEEKMQYADFVIVNNDFPNLECQVKAIHKNILKNIENSLTL